MRAVRGVNLAVALVALAACGSDAGTLVATSVPVAAPASVPSDSTAAPTTVIAGVDASAPSTTPGTPQLDGLAVAWTAVGEFEEPIALATRPGAVVPEPPYLLERAGVVRRLAEPDEIALDITDLTAPGGEKVPLTRVARISRTVTAWDFGLSKIDARRPPQYAGESRKTDLTAIPAPSRPRPIDRN